MALRRSFVGKAGTHRLQLSVPREELLLFDRRKWNLILNLSYIGTEEKMIKNIFTLPLSLAVPQ